MRRRLISTAVGTLAAAAAVAVPVTMASAATTVNVPATAGPSTNGGTGVVATGITVKGSVSVSATGTVSDATGSNVGPAGSGNCTNACFQASLPRLALIGQVGKNGAWQLVGAGPTTLSGNGPLSLAVNDSNYRDNTGAFSASVSTSSTTATSLTITASASRITAGQGVTLSTTLTRGGTPMANTTVALLAAKTGTTTFKQVATATTDANGVAKSTRHPSFNTTFEWSFAGSGNASPATSPTKAITVRTKVTLHVFDTTLGSGQPLVVWGATSPNKWGVTITIYRHTKAGNTKLGAVKVRSDGTWGFSHRVHSGSASVFAHIPATARNAAGASPKVGFSAA